MYIYCFIVHIFILVHAESQQPLREYVVVKDMYSGHKANQFSIYSNKAEDELRYRIESFYSPMQKIEIRTYPSKKVIAKLNAQQLGSWYQATYELLDTRKQPTKWFTGIIKRKYTWFSDDYNLNLAERKLTMKRKAFSRKFKIFNESKKLLAMYEMQRGILKVVTKYDLKIFSNEFPDSLYFLSIAAHEHKRTRNYGHHMK